MQTTVKREVCPGGEGGFVTGKPRDNRCNLSGFSETPDRNALDDGLQYFGANGTNHRHTTVFLTNNKQEVMEVEILREAVEYGRAKKWIARSPSFPEDVL